MTRSKKLFYNTLSSLACQIVTILCGFVLPRLMLESYGSQVNGLVDSITQFLGVITFLEMGVGAVIQSALYGPLARRDNTEISKILASATKFFRRLAAILLGYLCLLVLFYPTLSGGQFSWLYTATLIVSMSVSSFAQYYFGMVDQILLTADQRGYIRYTVQMATVALNTLACCVLIYGGASIQWVKLTTSLIYLLRPLAMRLYIKRHYQIQRNIPYEGEPIRQKWNGLAQHIAAVVLDGTDTIVLTLFATLQDVSIYSVYLLVVKGVKQLFVALTNGIQSLLGEMWARQEADNLQKTFGWVEWCIHTGTIFVFGCTAVLIVPFVQVYTSGIRDANYIQPLFGALLVAANAMHCLRLPYNLMVLAAGHYKQTQRNYIEVALINIVVSVLMVKALGLVGVAIGTVVAMSYQTLWLAWYNSRHLIGWPFARVLKQFVTDGAEIALIVWTSGLFSMAQVSYLSWIWLAIRVALSALAWMLAVNLLCYREMTRKMLRTVGARVRRK